MIDTTRFPKAGAYLAALPHGLASHPGCQVKGSILRQFLGDLPASLPLNALPPELAEVFATPPLPNAWVPEVSFNALMLLYQDLLAPKAYRDWIYEANVSLFRSPLYRILFLVVSPERVVAGAAARWKAFRRGTELVTVERRTRFASMELKFPDKLYDSNILGWFTVIFTAVCSVAGAKHCESQITTHEAGRAVIDIQWE